MIKQQGGVVMYDYIIIEDWLDTDITEIEVNDINEFNESLGVKSEDTGAQWVDKKEFATIYNYMRRFNHSYNTISCELMITVEPIVDEKDEWENIIQEFGEVVHSSLRISDSIMRCGKQFHLLLPEVTEQNKLVIINRLRKNLQDNGVYYLVDINIDAMTIGPDVEYETWYNVAV